MAEHGGDLAADQVQERPVPFRRGQCGQPQGGRLGAVGRAPGPARGVEHLPYLGQVPEGGAGPERGVRPGEAVPGEVRDEDGRVVVVEGPVQRGRGRGGVHGGQTVADQPLGDRSGGEAVTAPQAPGHRGAGQSEVAAVPGQRVEVGVGGGVTALAGAAERAGEGGEEHEGGEVEFPGEFVEVAGAVELGAQDPGRAFGGDRVDHPVVEDARGVQHGAERALGRKAVEQVRQRVAVCDVTGRDGDGGTESAQFGQEVVGPRGLGTASAGEQQVRGTGTGEPTGDLGAEAAGAAGDQDRALGGPVACGGGATESGVDDPAAVEAGGAYGQLVLSVRARQRSGEPGRGPVVEPSRQVDQAGPALRVLDTGDPAEPPDQGLERAADPVGAADRHRAPGGAPERGVGAEVAQGLEEGDRQGEAAGKRRSPVVGFLGQGEQ